MGVDGEVSSRMAQVAARFGIETEWVSPEALKINKNKQIEGSYLTDAKSPDATPKDVGTTPSINTTLSQNSVGVNSQFMQDGAEYAQGNGILPPLGKGARTAKRFFTILFRCQENK